MAMKNIKTLREEAEALVKAGVATREQLRGAVPALVALQSAERSLQLRIKETRAVIQALSDACSAYAHKHPEYVFDQTFSVSPIGVESGDIEIDGRTYHFTHGFDGYVRTEPSETLTQEFLKGLPEGWAKTRLSLDTTALNKAKPVLQKFEGWKKDLKKCGSYSKMPKNAKAYIEFIEDFTNTPVGIVSVGSDRNETYLRIKPWKK